MKCPSLNPRCDGELKVTETDPMARYMPPEIGDGVITMPWSCDKLAACCDKCGKRWTAEQLKTEGINIKEIPLK